MDDDPLAAAGLRLTREQGAGTISIWTQSAHSSFSGRQGRIALGGDVRTRMLGADYRRDRLITGMSLAHSLGIGEYDGVTSGEVRSSVTGLYPGIGYRATKRLTVWGVAGYGAGRMILTAAGGAQESGVSMAMTAGGTRGELVSGPGLNLAVKADALWVGTSIAGSSGPNGNLAAAHAGVTRRRTGMEGSRSYTLVERLALKPVVELGLRRDGGDAETGAGYQDGRRLEGEIGYGLAAGRFVGTPRFGFSTATFGRTYQLGYRLAAAEAGDVRFELGGDLQRSESAHRPRRKPRRHGTHKDQLVGEDTAGQAELAGRRYHRPKREGLDAESGLRTARRRPLRRDARGDSVGQQRRKPRTPEPGGRAR